MNHTEDLIYKLYDFFGVNNNILLAEKMGTTQQTISNWKTRDSIRAVAKKCKELGIYEQIFNSSTQTNEKDINNRFDNIENLFLDDTKFRLKDKLKRYTDESFIDWMNKMIPKKILITTLKQLSENKEEYNMLNSKHSLLERIQTLELSFINEKNRHQISNYIKNHLSKIECYILIQEHEEIMNYKGFWK